MMIIYAAKPQLPLESLVQDLVFEFPDFPFETLVMYLRRAAIIMCREGALSREKHKVLVWPGIENYLLETKDGTEILHILDVTDDRDRHIKRLTQAPSRDLWNNWEPVSWFEWPNTFFIRTSHRQPQEYVVELSTCPAQDACAIDAYLGEECYETLLTGARSLIYAVGNKPWANLGTADEYNRRFKAGIGEASRKQLVGHQRGLLQMKQDRVL
jgi:hypothetical protein